MRRSAAARPTPRQKLAGGRAPRRWAPRSLRGQLRLGILLPVVLFIGFNTWSLYRQTLASLHTACDRTLLASAKSIGEQLDVRGHDADATLHAAVPYSALEALETDNHSHMVYRVSTLQGTLVSGYAALPTVARAHSRTPAVCGAGGLLL